jgi:hypothetical protein
MQPRTDGIFPQQSGKRNNSKEHHHQKTWLPPMPHSPKPSLTSNSPSHKCARQASQPLPHRLLPPPCQEPVSTPLTGATPNLLGTRLDTAGRTATRSRLAIPATQAHCAGLAISPAQPGQTSWEAALTTSDTLSLLHPPPDGAHQRILIPSSLLV